MLLTQPNIDWLVEMPMIAMDHNKTLKAQLHLHKQFQLPFKPA